MPQANDQDRQPEPSEGLEYDLAHEWTSSPEGAADPTPRPGRHPTVHVITRTEDEGGDYGYDLAHDVPAP